MIGKIAIALVFVLLAYASMSDEKKEDIQSGISNIFSEVSNITNPINISLTDEVGETSTLFFKGKPHKTISYDCVTDSDCLEYGSDSVCSGGVCYA